jgi:carbonic anhydrase/acetyltransferase-like protein (isoleucine patch superfamily)
VIRGYKGVRPTLGARVFVDVSAQVIGDVELGDDASVWMNAVVRGDVNRIRIGARANVQDNCVLHVTSRHPTVVGDDVTVAHSVTLHGCTVERRCLVGIGALVLNGAVVGEESIVAAGALVSEGMRVPPGSLVMGVPARVRRGVTEEERAGLRVYAENYVGYKDTYRTESGAPGEDR